METHWSFRCENIHIYPPFKKGMYLEEYFLHMFEKENRDTKRKYIPCLWTNFQITSWLKRTIGVRCCDQKVYHCNLN